MNLNTAFPLPTLGTWPFSRVQGLPLGLTFLAGVLLPVVVSVDLADWVSTPPLWLVLLPALAAGALLALRRRSSPRRLMALALLLGAAGILGSTLAMLEEPTLAGRWSHLATHMGAWWSAATDPQGISVEPLPFTFILVGLTWAAGFMGAWAVVRWRNIWVGLLSGGLGLSVNLTHLPKNSDQHWLFLFLLFSFLLVAWSRTVPPKAPTPLRSESGAHLSRGLLWTLAILGIIFLLPHVRVHDSVLRETWGVMRDPFGFVERDFNRLFAALPGRAPYPYDAFSELLPFRGSIRLGPELALELTAPEPLYMAARRYTEYTPHGWLTGPITTVPLSGGTLSTQIAFPSPRSQKQVTYTVKPHVRTDTVFLGGRLIGGDRVDEADVAVPETFTIDPRRRSPVPPELEPAERALRELQRQGASVQTTERVLQPLLPQEFVIQEVRERNGLVTRVDVARTATGPPDVLAAELPRRGTSPYTVTVSVSTASESLLRTGSTDYPPFIRETYIPLPEDMPQRVHQLARELTASATNPYDKAVAIQDYLRGIEYTLDIPPPPPDRDAVDYFLFDLERGYSQYFGSSMAVLLRSVGIPARPVMGYGPGEEIAFRQYLVRDLNRHGWTEVYLGEFGWIIFEPTPGRPLPVRGTAPVPVVSVTTPTTGGALEDEEEEEEEPLGLGGQGGSSLLDLFIRGLLALGALGLAVGAVMAAQVWRRGMTGSLHASVLFRRVCWMARLGRVPPRPGETPLEFGNRLSASIPGAAPLVQDVVNAYVHYRYGSAQESQEDLQLLARWRNGRWRLLLGALGWR